MKKIFKKDHKKIISTFFVLMISGTIIDILLKVMAETPNPFFPLSMIKLLQNILPTIFDPLGWLIGILLTWLIYRLNKS